MATNYSRGATYERKIKKELEDQGYYVMRSAGSKGPADLIAIRIQQPLIVHYTQLYQQKPEVILIQCGEITKEKRAKLDRLANITHTKSDYYQIPTKRKANPARKPAKKKHMSFKRRKAGLSVKKERN